MTSIERVLADRSASDWLKQTLRSALARDCVDAANDAEVLATLLAECACCFTTSPARRTGSRRLDYQETDHA